MDKTCKCVLSRIGIKLKQQELIQELPSKWTMMNVRKAKTKLSF